MIFYLLILPAKKKTFLIILISALPTLSNTLERERERAVQSFGLEKRAEKWPYFPELKSSWPNDIYHKQTLSQSLGSIPYESANILPHLWMTLYTEHLFESSCFKHNTKASKCDLLDDAWTSLKNLQGGREVLRLKILFSHFKAI